MRVRLMTVDDLDPGIPVALIETMRHRGSVRLLDQHAQRFGLLLAVGIVVDGADVMVKATDAPARRQSVRELLF